MDNHNIYTSYHIMYDKFKIMFNLLLGFENLDKNILKQKFRKTESLSLYIEFLFFKILNQA